jgi:pSer/pThr/pTyr-binding forkhead associated (FHA) protein
MVLQPNSGSPPTETVQETIARRSATEPRTGPTFARDCRLDGPLRVLVHREASESAAEVVLHKPFAFFGRDSRADVRLDSSSVRRWHAFVQVVDGQLFVLDLTRAGGIRGPAAPIAWEAMKSSDELHIGEYCVRVVFASNDSTDQAETPTGEIVLNVDSPSGESVIEVPSEPITLLGRASRCTLRMHMPGVAPYHCALVRGARGLWLVDLRSGLTTRVNGRPVRFARLRDGDLIQAGEWMAVAGSKDNVPESRATTSATDAVAISPIQLTEQLQQCLLMMGTMFQTIQQEHSAIVRNLVSKLQLNDDHVHDRKSNAEDIPFAESLCDFTRDRFTTLDQTEPLVAAHQWFSQRLSRFSSARR